jgi:hypothetical protein
MPVTGVYAALSMAATENIYLFARCLRLGKDAQPGTDFAIAHIKIFLLRHLIGAPADGFADLAPSLDCLTTLAAAACLATTSASSISTALAIWESMP